MRLRDRVILYNLPLVILITAISWFVYLLAISKLPIANNPMESELRVLSYARISFFYLGVILLGLAFVLIVSIFLSKSITKPIQKLLKGIEILANGNLNYKIPESPKRATKVQDDETTVLAQAFNKMAKKLKESQKRAIITERLATIGQLASSVGHEIRNPLSVIENTLYLLRNSNPNEFSPLNQVQGQGGQSERSLTERQQEYLSIIEREVSRCNKIIKDLLDFTRTNPASMKETNLNLVILEVLANINFPSGITLIKRLKEELPLISADPDHLYQAFLNIITNGIEAMDGKGRLLIETRDSIKLKSASGGQNSTRNLFQGKIQTANRQPQAENGQRSAECGYVEVVISDTGCGIKEEDLEKIFVPLWTTKSKGIGLGLSLAHKFIKENYGDIIVESEVNKGTTFILRFPTQQETFGI